MSFGANAQINSGTMLFGGSASFNHRVHETALVPSSSTSLSIRPQFGIAVADNFVVGAWASTYLRKNYTNWSVSPFMRYYMKNFYAQAGYGYTHSVISDNKMNGSILDFELGYAAFLNDHVALEPALYYNGTFDGKTYRYSDYGIKIGIQIYFNR